MQHIALEVTWVTKNWDSRVFSYFMATTGSNAQYAFKYFVQKPQENVIKFCQNMVKDIIYNKWVPDS
eukprot:15290193-Ditylum_brightwellii.AAC.1